MKFEDSVKNHSLTLVNDDETARECARQERAATERDLEKFYKDKVKWPRKFYIIILFKGQNSRAKKSSGGAKKSSRGAKESSRGEKSGSKTCSLHGWWFGDYGHSNVLLK